MQIISYGCRLGVLVCALAPMLSACGGSIAGPRTLPAASASPASAAGKLRATISLTFPNRNDGTSAHRRATYVSPATQSAQVTVLSGTTTIASQGFALGVNASGCTATLATTNCQLNIELVPGTYDVMLIAYDGPVVNGTATGTALSAAQHVPFVVAPGSNNSLSLVLGGIPTTVLIAPLGAQPWISGNPTSGYTLPSGKATTFDVVSLDPDGDAIIGPGAPTIAVTQTAGTVAVTQPATPTPGQFVVSATFSASLSTGSFTVTVTPAADSGAATIAQTIPVAAAATHFYVSSSCVATAGTSGTCLSAFVPGSTVAAQTTGIAAQPNLMAVDANGNITVGYGNATAPNGTAEQTLLALAAPSHAQTATVTLPAGQYLSGLAADAGGNVYVTTVPSALGDGYVDEYPLPSGGFTRSIDLTNGGYPIGLALDGSGDVFVDDASTSHVLQFGPTGTTSVRTLDPTQLPNFTQLGLALAPVQFPQPIAADVTGDLYVSSSEQFAQPSGSNPTPCANARSYVQVIEFAPGASTPGRVLPLAESNACTVTALATDALGNLYVGIVLDNGTAPISGSIEVYPPAATVPIRTIPLVGVPFTIVADTEGDITTSLLGGGVDMVVAGTIVPQTLAAAEGGHYAIGFGP